MQAKFVILILRMLHPPRLAIPSTVVVGRRQAPDRGRTIAAGDRVRAESQRRIPPIAIRESRRCWLKELVDDATKPLSKVSPSARDAAPQINMNDFACIPAPKSVKAAIEGRLPRGRIARLETRRRMVSANHKLGFRTVTGN